MALLGPAADGGAASFLWGHPVLRGEALNRLPSWGATGPFRRGPVPPRQGK